MNPDDCRFGMVVRHPSWGLGMIEFRVPKTETVVVCFATEAVNTDPYDFVYVGNIYTLEKIQDFVRDFEAKKKKTPPPKRLPAKRHRKVNPVDA
jgi:hypothetical protein